MNLYKLHTHPETLPGYEKYNTCLIDLLRFAQDDNLEEIAKYKINDGEFSLENIIGKCPFDSDINTIDKIYNEDWLKLKPDFIEWLKA